MFKSLMQKDKLKEVKGVFNVDTTTTQSPQQVMEEIHRVLELEKLEHEEFKMEYKLKGHVFKCSYPMKRLKFQLEICKIKNLDLTGVKLRRVKGDLWVYKEHCQRLMAKLKL
jgi:MAP/microtubule affinity-regulating kinase